MVQVDARGTGKSQGKRDPLGVSYLAIIQWLVAAQRPAGLAAIIPWEGFTDPYRDAAFHGGIPETAFLPWWLSGRGGVPGSDAEPVIRESLPWPTRLPLPGLLGLGAKMRCGVTPLVDEIPLPHIDLAAIEVPTLICASWSAQGLHTRGAFTGCLRLGSTEKWLYNHGGPSSPTQPFSLYHTLRKPDLTERDMWGISPVDQMLCRIQFREAASEGIHTPPTSGTHWIP